MEEKTHIGVYGLILKGDELLLVKKSRGAYIGKLDLPGGRPNFGEDLYETLFREIKEESGILIRKANLFQNYACTVEYSEGKKKKVLYHIALIYLILEYDDSNMQSVVFEDVEGLKWVSLEKIRTDELSSIANYAIQRILN